jgi:ribose transport system permease protein
VLFSVWSRTGDTFSSAANLRILVANQAVIGIIALGALIPLIANEWDLSVGAIAGTAAIFSASAMSGGRPVLVAIAIALGIGTAVGLSNALLVTRVHVNGVITTLGMSTILSGVINQKTGGRSVASNIPSSVVEFGSRNWFGIPRVAFALAIVAVGVYYLLDHTPFGRYLYAMGSNPRAARLVGLRTTLIVAASFVLAGLLAGVGGVLQVARQAGADPRVGESFTLPALAAAFLSAASIKPGKYNVGGTLVAIFFLATLNSGLSLAGAPAYVSRYVNGAALIIGVGIAAFVGRRRLRATGS